MGSNLPPRKNVTKVVFIFELNHGKPLNLPITTANSKYLSLHGIMSLIYLMNHNLHQTFNISFEYIIKKHETIIHPHHLPQQNQKLYCIQN